MDNMANTTPEAAPSELALLAKEQGITTLWLHTFRTPNGNIVVIRDMAEHATEAEARACPGWKATIADPTGLATFGLAAEGVYEVLADDDGIYIPGVNVDHPFLGLCTYVAGPRVEEAKAAMLAEGKPLPDYKDPAYRAKLKAEWMEQEAAQASAELASLVAEQPKHLH